MTDKPNDFLTDPLWYKDAIIYELHIKAFYDSNADGSGDFAGLIHKLDYLQHLGINTIWLLPFYPSPMRDDGYDIADYRNVAPEYGTRAQFRNFVREAHRRGLRVITELVINHTSDLHPWFEAARHAPRGSPKRNYYVWSDTNAKYAGTRIIFKDAEKSNWSWDSVAQAYYWHRFFAHQPDLNFDNPNVLRAVIRIMSFWLAMGVDGFRLDAVPYLVEREGTDNENLPETHLLIKKLRSEIDARFPGRMLLAEANQWPEDVREYFGEGDECHMAYHFPLMPRMYMAIAQQDRHPITEILRQTPDIPDTCQWAIFLRNHDELTLEMVTSRERDYLYGMYATDPRARLNLGIRRRLAPLMDNDSNKIRLMNFVLLTMPGSPVIYYGDEIGMGDNIYLGDRNSVRTPMQWSPDRNGGFSRADPQQLYLPLNMDPLYGYETVNVEAQLRNHSSLLNWMRRMLATRKKHAAFGRGSIEFLYSENRKILSYLRIYEDEIILCLANLASSPQAVELNLSKFKGRIPLELGWETAFPRVGDFPYFFTLPGHGYYAFRLATDADVPTWQEAIVSTTELPTLVMIEGLRTLFMDKRGAASEVRRAVASRTRRELQSDILKPFLVSKRWFAGKGKEIVRTYFSSECELTLLGGGWLLTFVDVEFSDGDKQRYFVPMTIAWEEKEETNLELLGPWALAKVRQRDRMGALINAFGDDAFCRAILLAVGEDLDLPCGDGRVRFRRGKRYVDIVGDGAGEVRRPTLDQSNVGVFFGNRVYLKGYQNLQSGVNPEIEVASFLAEHSTFSKIPLIAGSIELVGRDGEVTCVGMLSEYVENQGSAWEYSGNYLEQSLEMEEALASSVPGRTEPSDIHAAFASRMGLLGQRTAELHSALAGQTEDAAFAPEPITVDDLRSWVNRVELDLQNTLAAVSKARGSLSESLRAAAAEALARGVHLSDELQRFPAKSTNAVKTRYHGDYHLGQVLVVGNDFVITDFEGEPARAFLERRRKHSPLRDVAGMLRSFDYAAKLAVDRFSQMHPSQHARLEESAARWSAQCREAFFASYQATAEGQRFFPSENGLADNLIRLFEFEKMLYELRYELEHRPLWVHIPLHALQSIELKWDTAAPSQPSP